MNDPWLTEALLLLDRYKDNCDCKGDQYGSPGPCEKCVDAGYFFNKMDSYGIRKENGFK